MPIRTIEVICLPCQKCEKIKKAITEAIKGIEIQNKIQIAYDFRHTITLKDLVKYSVNASQAPVVIVNGQVEFAGQVETATIRKNLETIHRRG